MIFIDFTQNGGYPLKQGTLLKLQSTYYQIFSALIAQLGITDVGKYILKGCAVVGANIEPGIMYIDGQICTFDGAAGDLTTKIIRIENATTLPFKNGSNLAVVKDRKAVVDAAGTLLSDFVRQPIVIDANYVHTDNNYTDAEVLKLFGIEPGAQVNLQPDWLQTNITLSDFIKNKPDILPVLHKGVSMLGDFPVGTTSTTNILFPDVGTTDYLVFGAFKSNSSFGFAGADLLAWFTAGYETNKFRLGGREFQNEPQNVEFHYLIVKA